MNPDHRCGSCLHWEKARNPETGRPWTRTPGRCLYPLAIPPWREWPEAWRRGNTMPHPMPMEWFHGRGCPTWEARAGEGQGQSEVQGVIEGIFSVNGEVGGMASPRKLPERELSPTK